jgi:oxygen-independent coproporphyrinogen-3 oxidase
VYYAAQLANLASQGYARLENDGVTLSRGGLLEVDRLLHDFFLPQHIHARYT